jgi:uncharacterized protein YciI
MVFVVILEFTAARSNAAAFMQGHLAWLARGFDDGVFFFAGSLAANAGGAVLATGETRNALRDRVDTDPFVTEGIVTAEILEISPSKADPRLAFLLG